MMLCDTQAGDVSIPLAEPYQEPFSILRFELCEVVLVDDATDLERQVQDGKCHACGR